MKCTYKLTLYDNDNTGYTYYVVASSTDEAIEKAKAEHNQPYRLLEVEDRIQTETYSYEYAVEVTHIDPDGSHTMNRLDIEADNSVDAIKVAIEFTLDDYENNIDIVSVNIAERKEIRYA